MGNETLRACPFCDGEAYRGSNTVECMDIACNALGPLRISGDPLTAWNTRPREGKLLEVLKWIARDTGHTSGDQHADCQAKARAIIKEMDAS